MYLPFNCAPQFFPSAACDGTIPPLPPMMQAFGPMGNPLGMMPTPEQREDFSLAFLDNQKKQIEQTKHTLNEYIKMLDQSLQSIEKEISNIANIKAKRKKTESS